jgi:DNA mismatch repair protein MutS2
LALTSEACGLLETLGRQPYHDLPDPSEALAVARVRGERLGPAALRDVASFIEGAVEIASRVAVAERAPRLAREAAGLGDTRAVAGAIRRAILPSGEVADDASPRLAELRRRLLRLREQLRSVIESCLRRRDAERVLQDDIVTTRNDRYVLLIKAEHRGQVPGIVHGSSGSGASLFVEPMPAVEVNNDLVATQDEERAEVARILTELTALVGARAAEIDGAAEVMGALDARQAMALLARDMDAVEPEIGTDRLRLADARHPLLLAELSARLGQPRRSTREAVPVTLVLGDPERVLVISGPNTGGKTVALKTAGLLSLMAQSGLHVPAAPGTVLPVFRRVFADIGDDQSIAQNLSTFSAHLAAIGEMTQDLLAPALVLLDEVGGGTDPTEGGPLGIAVVEHFRRQGAMVVATTHHGLMRAYAQSTPGVACAAFGYDPETYEPNYRLAYGSAGRSLALEMAERLGLPSSVVSEARARREDKERQAEDLLRKLEADEAALHRAEEGLRADRHELRETRARLEEEERTLRERRVRMVAAFARELEERSEALARRAGEAIRDAVERVHAARQAEAAARRATAGVALVLEDARGEALRDLPVPVPEPELALPLAVGMRVRVRSLGLVGELTSLPSEGPAELAVGGKRVRVARGELVALAGGARGGGGTALVRALEAERPTPAELNLVGLTVDEALPRVDKWLDDAALSDRRQLRVVHGFGSGRLRQAVTDLLRRHPHVASFRAGQPGEGGGGATVVELRE